MNYKVIPTPEFIKNLKTLKKKYKNITNDVLELANELENNPTMGIDLGNNTFKIRIKNSDNNKGKSVGYRIITYCINDIKEVSLVTIYSKSEKENILDLELKELITRLSS
ncbi:type II toxin-antitoxin system RelE/ParE family toxin [Sulfurimonas sp.]|uniref:type II toxin-antitoxin system RelE/ParE family toxin n=1 Tax=Sulfurimonas sp. TaxID=2022749 RepID=UPI00262A0B34|nr:type II toxin-antitoxin system RelE/ParE family toxin [Sulfurimonas sp.]